MVVVFDSSLRKVGQSVPNTPNLSTTPNPPISISYFITTTTTLTPFYICFVHPIPGIYLQEVLLVAKLIIFHITTVNWFHCFFGLFL